MCHEETVLRCRHTLPKKVILEGLCKGKFKKIENLCLKEQFKKYLKIWTLHGKFGDPSSNLTLEVLMWTKTAKEPIDVLLGGVCNEVSLFLDILPFFRAVHDTQRIPKSYNQNCVLSLGMLIASTSIQFIGPMAITPPRCVVSSFPKQSRPSTLADRWGATPPSNGSLQLVHRDALIRRSGVSGWMTAN